MLFGSDARFFRAERHYKRMTSVFPVFDYDYYYGMVVFIRLVDKDLELFLERLANAVLV